MILKGQTASNDWVEFRIHNIIKCDQYWTHVWNMGEYVTINTDTICLADDPRKEMLKEILSTLENAYLDRIATTQEDIGGNTWMMFGDILHVNEDVIGEMEAKL